MQPMRIAARFGASLLCALSFLAAPAGFSTSEARAEGRPFEVDILICRSYREGQGRDCDPLTALAAGSGFAKASAYMEFVWQSAEIERRPRMKVYFKWTFTRADGAFETLSNFETNPAYTFEPRPRNQPSRWYVNQSIWADTPGVYRFTAFLDRSDHDGSQIGEATFEVKP